MTQGYTALIRREGDWWVGSIEEVTGVVTQGETREDLLENLQSALAEAIEMNRADAMADLSGEYEEVSIAV